MKAFGKFVVKFRYVILGLALLLLIPSAIGYFNTRVNYDLLYYLPDGIDTMTGQDILMEDFGTGAFCMVVVKDMEYKDVAVLKEKIENVDHVAEVIWYDTIADLSIPEKMLPSKVGDAFNTDDSTLMMVIFDDTSSGDGTMQAISDIRKVADKQCFLSGISAIVTDTRDLSEQETPIYVVIAVALSTIILSLLMDSWVIPIFFLLSIGMAIVYNLGSNLFFGQISYITKALTAVLQLGVTMDYSIFLWHSYEEQMELCDHKKEEAMANAIAATITSVVGSSITTIAGFIALCFMSFTLGLDLGVVMAKGVVLGVVACVTILPSLILTFDGLIRKTHHKPLIPEFKKLPGWILKHYKLALIIFLALLGPAVYGYTHSQVYYDLSESLPKTLTSVVATDVLKQEYNLSSASIVLTDSTKDPKSVRKMMDEMKEVDGVSAVLGKDSILDGSIPEDFIPKNLTSKVSSDEYELVVVMSDYKTGSDEANAQCNALEKIIKKYDEKGMLVGEAACTRDLIEITNKDFAVVSSVSILAIFAIILIVYRSALLPILLVAVIEFAIFINMGIPCYTNEVLPFIASIVIGTIQLGATVDYAILMTTRYSTERNSGKTRKEAVYEALNASIRPIMVSGLSFFGATFGVGIYSSIDMISSLCKLMARGALISMFCVICILPAMLMLFDKPILYTSLSFKKARVADRNRKKYQENA